MKKSKNKKKDNKESLDIYYLTFTSILSLLSINYINNTFIDNDVRTIAVLAILVIHALAITYYMFIDNK